MAKKLRQHIVIDGGRRAYLASINKVRVDVEREFSEALAQAGFLRRIFLRVQMNREIKGRMREIAPPWALYFRPRS
jgi:hypothetical protein